MIVTQHEANSGPDGVSFLKRGVRILGRHWLLALLVFAVVFAACLLPAWLTPRQYTAEAAIAIDARKVQVILQDAVVSRLPSESPALRSEMDLITSRLIAERVVDQLGVDKHLLDTPSESAESLLKAGAKAWDRLRGVPRPHVEQVAESPETERKRLVNGLLSNLRVSNDGRSYTIFISYHSRDPEFSARVANTVADSYLANQVAVQVAATRGAGEWLGGKVADLRATLEKSEIAVQNFRNKQGLLDQNGQSLQSLRAMALNVELATARAAVAGAEARFKTARELAAGDAGLNVMTEIINSNTVQLLRRDEQQLVRTLKEIEEAGLSRNPQLQSLKTQLASVRAQIAVEIDRILTSLSNELQIAKQKELELEQAFAAVQVQVAIADEAAIELRHLEREATANRAIYESFLSRYKQTIEQEGLASPEARLISWAEASSAIPSSRTSFVILGLFAGAGLAAASVFVRSQLDDRIWSSAQIEQSSRVPLIGSLPQLPFWRRMTFRRKGLRPILTSQAALQKLVLALGLSRNDADGKVLVVTSTTAREGKTHLCSSLARSLARLGCRVALVEADLYRSGLSSEFKHSRSAYLDEVLLGTRQLDEVIQEVATDIDLIPGRYVPSQGGILFWSEAFGDMLKTLKKRYSVVIVDTPAVCSSADAVLVASYADLCIFAVRFGWTKAERAMLALRQLVQCNIAVTGIVMTRVSAGRHGHYEAAVWHREGTPIVMPRREGGRMRIPGRHTSSAAAEVKTGEAVKV